MSNKLTKSRICDQCETVLHVDDMNPLVKKEDTVRSNLFISGIVIYERMGKNSIVLDGTDVPLSFCDSGCLDAYKDEKAKYADKGEGE